jgi:hypothetical protein
MQSQLPTLQNQMISIETGILDEFRKIEENWNSKKPYSGDLMPKEALDIINITSG